MTAFLYHLSYDFRTGIRDKSQMLMNYLFPLFFYFMMGLLMSKINPGFKDYMIPGMILFTALTGTVLSMPNPLVSARETGILRSYRINGVPAFNIILVPILTGMAHLALASAIIAVTAGPLFGAVWAENGNIANLLLVFLVMAFTFASVGMLIGVISPNTRITMLFSQVIYIPSIMLSGIIMPISILPAGLARISFLLPTTYAMEAFRGLAWGLNSTMNPNMALVILLIGGLTALGLAAYLFSWDSHETSRRRSPYLALIAFLPYIIGVLLIG
jgi:ABC-2 type transport system permease protein